MKYSEKKTCFASVDIEHDAGSFTDKKFAGIKSIEKLVSLFKKYSIPATFFVTGDVLSGFSDRVFAWARDYEIASHSYTHKYFNELSNEQKVEDIKKFNEIYVKLFGYAPKGFRAPSHVIDNFTTKTLEENGFLYDSSVVPHYPPLKNYRGYCGDAPRRPYRPSPEVLRQVGDMNILEIPVTGQMFGIPLAGAWINKLPYSFYEFLFALNSPDFITLSIHSWDGIADKGFYKKLEKIILLLKNKGYAFKSGYEIYVDLQ